MILQDDMEKQTKFKVLLVDDEEIFREATARQLRVRGFAVLTADSGETALDLVRTDPPEVVLLDQEMPGMHGSDTFIAIKEINPLIEVIMLTGNTSVENALELMKLGTFDYLMKPVNIDELLYKVEDAHARKQLNERKQQRDSNSTT
jgi:DNA-binding NtrC family response regulator